MDAVKYLKEAKRMCDVIGDCRKCPINGLVNGLVAVIPCKLVEDNLELANPEKAVEIVEKWAAEHPKKTRQSEFLKTFPNAKLGDSGILWFFPCDIDTSYKHSKECDNVQCWDCRKKYWLAEVDND